MPKKVLILSGSPKKNGNTSALIEWFKKGALSKKATVETVQASSLKLITTGCNSCRICQKRREYGCVIRDDATPVIARMAAADVIVLATPLYFFSVSAQLKTVIDRMFSLYKWDNDADTMETVLKGKTMVLLASAYEDIGLKVLEKPFKLTAGYSGMKYFSLLIPNAGVSGDIRKKPGVRQKVIALGRKIA